MGAANHNDPLTVRPVPYGEIVAAAREESNGDVGAFLREELLFCWQDRYLAASAGRPTEPLSFRYGSFDYLCDIHQQAQVHDAASGRPPVEARLVGVIGTSAPQRTKRDDPRLRGLTISAMPGPDARWDRGHYIGHAIGGVVDGNEANVFLQLRSVNRGRYRTMESYCGKNAGVTCFSRPIYGDTSAHPVRVEFGVLRTDGVLWLGSFPNRPDGEPAWEALL